MKNLTFAKYPLVFLACLLLSTLSLNAQNEDVVLTDFKAFSFINSNQVVDSLDYNPEAPTGGPVQFLEDSLVVVTPDGSFQLNYTPTDNKAFVAIWVDTNENGLFEAEEAIYEGEANEGSLADTLNLPIFNGSRPALVAISSDQKNLVDPREIPGNPEISSLRFIMRSNPPKLTTTSKKEGIIDVIPEFCDTLVTFVLKNDSTSNCVIASQWTITYGQNTTVTADPNTVTLSPSGSPYGIGQMIDPGDSLNLALDITGLPIADNDTVKVTFYFVNCYDSNQVDSTCFQFINCKANWNKDFHGQFDSTPNFSLKPNPVQSATIIEYEVLKSSQLHLSLRNLEGRLIEIIYTSKYVQPGLHKIEYSPPPLPAGTYIISLHTNFGVTSKKIILLGY